MKGREGHSNLRNLESQDVASEEDTEKWVRFTKRTKGNEWHWQKQDQAWRADIRA